MTGSRKPCMQLLVLLNIFLCVVLAIVTNFFDFMVHWNAPGDFDWLLYVVLGQQVMILGQQASSFSSALIN
jgi:hypothetical protein